MPLPASRRRQGLAAVAAFTVLLGGAPQAHAQPRGDAYPSNNLQPETGKPGVFAYRLPGPYYGVSAYLDRKRSEDTDTFLRTLARLVLLRSAQLALDNDREFFSIVGEIGTATVGAKDVLIRGQAPYRAPDQCGRGPTGQPYCIPGAKDPGTPNRISRDPGAFGRKATVQIWTKAESEQIAAGTMRNKPSGELLSAEAAYITETKTAPGRWPSIYQLYENRAREGERMLARQGPQAIAARTQAAKAYSNLGRAHSQAGDLGAANLAWAKAKRLIDEGLALEGFGPDGKPLRR